MEGDYEQKVQDLSAEKEVLGKEKVEKEKEAQVLLRDIKRFKEQVLTNRVFSPFTVSQLTRPALCHPQHR